MKGEANLPDNDDINELVLQFEKLRKIANSLKEGDVVVIDQPFLWPIIELLIGERKVLYIAHKLQVQPRINRYGLFRQQMCLL